ncbi:AraC family transcriptional regulator [Mesoflavibacter profundi]|uniref:AraC family transcriptional regulator n=1 Tax=Mesoflavibacter profundi TaxID=2708110 RepID=A0ABT4S194_9FLAO|nr:AraC family transcriptional regulator [Mesoflavibacter profundi]MDA0177829.1 AraC family transcriptional regulator [Mesoflavibacter profundi]
MSLSTSNKNVAKGSFEETQVDDHVFVLSYQNESAENQVIERYIDSSYIQFHFCLKGESTFVFNNGNYRLDIKEESSLLLYNPERDLPIHLEVNLNCWLVTLIISIEKFHSLFSQEANYVTFLSEDNRDKKYYKDGKISPSMAITLNQIVNYNLNSSIKNLYFKGKAYELLSLYFNRAEDADTEQCPFLVDETNVAKIKRAKDIIIAKMSEPPTLQELSEDIGLPLKKLKEGFKQIYGDSVFSFLFDYKMEVARKLLESGAHNVNEVGLKVGYSTASHFIAAFKKKYGITPKKYIQSK